MIGPARQRRGGGTSDQVHQSDRRGQSGLLQHPSPAGTGAEATRETQNLQGPYFWDGVS